MRRARHATHARHTLPYVNPFPSGGTTWGRIDQGQDFGGTGPIRAIGRARILKTKSPWPEYSGGAGILYQLLEGPDKGRTVYVYEGVKTNVRAGQVVQAGQVIGSIIPGTSSGIETGWADPHTGQPTSAAEYAGLEDGTPTKGGNAFASFLNALKRQPTSPAAERRYEQALAKEEGGGTGIPGSEQASNVEGQVEAHGVAGAAEHFAGDAASGLLSGIFGEIHPEALMLNIALVGGGAFLTYYGAALMLGVKKPVASPAKAVAP